MIDSHTMAAAQAPRGFDHLVINVRDIEESHRFWTEMIGFRHVGTSGASAPGRPRALLQRLARRKVAPP